MSLRQSTRLSVADWTRTGLEMLATEGVAGLRIQRLCDVLGVTKGSFYWHFADLDSYLGALAAAWAQDRGGEPRLDTMTGTPTERLLVVMELSIDPSNAAIERAMRDWARHDPRAREAVDVLDRRTFAELVEAFELMGFGERDADLRAKVLLYTGIGFSDAGPIGDTSRAREQVARTVELLTRA